MIPKLYIFPISHFSEKARWGLELANQPYELCLLEPGPHHDTIRSMVPESSLPVLAYQDRVIQGSSNILDDIDVRAFGRELSAEERILSDEIDAKFGRALQTILYSYLLEKPEIIAKLFSTVPLPKEKIAEPPKDFSVIALFLKRKYRISPKNVESAKASFQELGSKLQEIYKTQTFFDGNSFSRIDLSVASLISPIFQPEHHPANLWFNSVNLPQEMLDWAFSQNLDLLFDRVKYFYLNFRKQN